jgi:glycosyltransferase involved in cell wall biosynthesis
VTALVCWQPLLTDHQRHTLDALGAELGTIPEYIVAKTANAERDAQGWTRIDATLTRLPKRGTWGWAKARLALDDTIHIFGSPFEDRRLIGILILAIWSGARVWLISEPWSTAAYGYFADRLQWSDRVRAALRPWLYRVYGWLISRRVAGVFTISPLAAAQYGAIGVPVKRIFPFGYFVPEPAELPSPTVARPALRAVFVGALIARKGIAELAAAAKLLADDGAAVTIDVFGPGQLPPGSAALRYCGHIAFGNAARIMARYDVLVVPSRHDGWAVVVNEALMAGVAVIASDRTGAGAMIDRWGCGARFAAGDTADLARTLTSLAGDPAAVASMRAAARALAPALTPARAATYMAAALRGQPEANPWY